MGGRTRPRKTTARARGGRGEPESKIKPYDRVITKEAKTSPGLFLVHRIEDKVYFEIPTAELGKEMLWVTQLEQTQAGHSYGGEPVGDRVVRWEQRGDDILLRDVKYEIRAEVSDPIKDAVKAASLEAIIAVLPIQAFGKDKRPVIDVTPVLTGDLPEFSARRRLSASGIDPRRTFIEKVKAFPTNIEAKVLMTYRPRGGGGLTLPGGPTIPIGGDSDQGGVTVMLHHSLIDLPEKPMKPRRYDDRVGYLLRLVRGLRQPQAGGGAGPVHHALAAREERPEGRGLRAEEADRLLHRPRGAGEVPALDQEGDRGLAAGVREGRASRTPSSARSRPPRRKTPTGTPRTPAIPPSAGSPPPSRTPTGRTSTTPAPARSSKPISACITTSSSWCATGTSSRPRRTTPRPRRCPCPTT